MKELPLRRSSGLALAVIGLIGLWYLATIRAGQSWGDDFSLYLAHARNLAEGRPYADTGYIYNPSYPALSPRTYPPICPLLLAPVVSRYGLDFRPLKVELILLCLAFLLVLFVSFRNELALPYLLATLLLVGFNPFLWFLKDSILSDIPFLLFTYLTLFLFQRAADEARPRGRRLRDALLAGLTMYLAVGTRTAGIVLLPCLFLEELLRRRRLSLVSFAVLPLFAVGMLVQKLLLPFDSSYLDQLRFSPALYAHNLLELVKLQSAFFANGYNQPLRIVLFVAVAIPAGVEFCRRLFAGATVREIFVLLYGVILVLWPSSTTDQRFLLPLFPLFIVYACQGLHRLGSLAGVQWERRLALGLAAALLLTYVGRYNRIGFGPRLGIDKPESQSLFDYVRTATAPDAVFLFEKPRALALFTGRRAAAAHAAATDQELWHYLGNIHASYIVIDRVFEDSEYPLQPFVSRHPDRLEEVYHNTDFTVYRIRTTPVAIPGVASTVPSRSPAVQRAVACGLAAALNLKVDRPPHQVHGATLDLREQPADVLTDDAEAEQLHAGQEEHGQDQRRPAAGMPRVVAQDGPVGQVLNEEEHAGGHREQADAHPQQRDQPQRLRGEVEDAVQGQVDQLAERILRLACRSGLPLVRQARLPEADPRAQPANEATVFRQRVQRVERPAVHHTEVARIQGNRDARQRSQQAIEEPVAHPLDEVLLALGADGIDDVASLPALLEEAQQFLGRILQIGVDDRDDVASGVLQAGRHRGLVPEVSREGEHLQVRVAAGEFLRHGKRMVVAAVIHQDDFVVFLPGDGTGRQAFVEQADAVSLVVGWDHYRNHGWSFCW